MHRSIFEGLNIRDAALYVVEHECIIASICLSYSRVEFDLQTREREARLFRRVAGILGHLAGVDAAVQVDYSRVCLRAEVWPDDLDYVVWLLTSGTLDSLLNLSGVAAGAPKGVSDVADEWQFSTKRTATEELAEVLGLKAGGSAVLDLVVVRPRSHASLQFGTLRKRACAQGIEGRQAVRGLRFGELGRIRTDRRGRVRVCAGFAIRVDDVHDLRVGEVIALWLTGDSESSAKAELRTRLAVSYDVAAGVDVLPGAAIISVSASTDSRREQDLSAVLVDAVMTAQRNADGGLWADSLLAERRASWPAATAGAVRLRADIENRIAAGVFETQPGFS